MVVNSCNPKKQRTNGEKKKLKNETEKMTEKGKVPLLKTSYAGKK